MRKLSSRLGRLLRTTGLALAVAWPAYADSQFEIIRDTWGVPHIYAEDTFGLFAGYGYHYSCTFLRRCACLAAA